MADPEWWRDADAPARPREVRGGIRIHAARGAVARTWWSQRFLGVLEQLGVGGRLSRGKSYARAGQIVDLDVDAGAAVAHVQGTRPRPYRVRLGVPAFGKAEWGRVAQALVDDASYAAALLVGEMPRDIEDVFAAQGLSLFPASAAELAMDCTCPDHVVPCKHLAAVCYVLVEQRVREALLEDLRARRAATAEPGTGPAPLEDLLDVFYSAGPGADQRITGPDVPPDALLDQVPPFPVAVRGEPVVELLRPVYRALGADRAGPGGTGA
jgi:hypothetical protein